MTRLKLYEYPHPVLRQKAEKVAVVDDDLRKVLDDMLETMYVSNGCGLAAPQVGLKQRMVVIDIAHEDEEPQPLYMVNPEIVWHSEDKELNEEGCLSLPGQRAEVERPTSVKVRYTDYHGKDCALLAEGFLAIAVQHELDHLDGVLYIDHLSRLKRQMLLKKLDKFRKEHPSEE
jgi:peptide deformylase